MVYRNENHENMGLISFLVFQTVWNQVKLSAYMFCSYLFYFTLIKNTILTALTPQTTVVFPSLTKAEPSAVDIEPENIDWKNN